MNVFRYKFSETFLQHLKQFTFEHYTEDTITYRLSWNAWVLLNTEIINTEMKRLKSLGYDGNIEKKMYKSTRYWYKNKINKENKKNEKRRDYIELNKKFLNLIDKYIKSVDKIESIKPNKSYEMFINDKKYQSYIKAERNRLFNEGLDGIEITKKMKKTYKNKLYNFKIKIKTK